MKGGRITPKNFNSQESRLDLNLVQFLHFLHPLLTSPEQTDLNHEIIFCRPVVVTDVDCLTVHIFIPVRIPPSFRLTIIVFQKKKKNVNIIRFLQ